MDTNNAWDIRFAEQQHLYSQMPNPHFVQFLSNKKPGKLLLPGDGEGRHAIYAARQGWEVTSVDYSKVGLEHAAEWARQENLEIEFIYADITQYEPPKKHFDAVAQIYLHLPEAIRADVHLKLSHSLKKGGSYFLYGFTKEQLGKTSGGPPVYDLLYDPGEVIFELDLSQMSTKVMEFELDEGPKHRGLASIMMLEGIR